MAAFVGLYFVAKFSNEKARSKTHPPIQKRIRVLFDKVGDAPVSHFWNFATALICELEPRIAEMPVVNSDISNRDLAYFALKSAFG